MVKKAFGESGIPEDGGKSFQADWNGGSSNQQPQAQIAESPGTEKPAQGQRHVGPTDGYDWTPGQDFG